MARLHKYVYTLTLWTTDGVSSPDDMIDAFIKDADARPHEYQVLEAELHDRATCPTSFDIPEPPPWPADKSGEPAYWIARDKWTDQVCSVRRDATATHVNASPLQRR